MFFSLKFAELDTKDKFTMIVLDLGCALCFASAAAVLESLDQAHGVSFYSGTSLAQLSCGICSFVMLIALWLTKTLATTESCQADFSYLFGLSLATIVILICELQ